MHVSFSFVLCAYHAKIKEHEYCTVTLLLEFLIQMHYTLPGNITLHS